MMCHDDTNFVNLNGSELYNNGFDEVKETTHSYGSNTLTDAQYNMVMTNAEHDDMLTWEHSNQDDGDTFDMYIDAFIMMGAPGKGLW